MMLTKIRQWRNKKSISISLKDYVDYKELLPNDHLLRLGTLYGGWIIPKNNSLNQNSICYLAGAGEDISFDCELATRYQCKVKIIDPTPKAIRHFEELSKSIENHAFFPINNSANEFYTIDKLAFANISFIPVGLSNTNTTKKFFFPKNENHVSCSIINLQKTETYFEAPCCQLASIMLKENDKKIDLIKLDIEGEEYSVITNMLNTGIVPEILLVEFDEVHTPIDKQAKNRIEHCIKQLHTSGLRCIAIEGCNATFVKKL